MAEKEKPRDFGRCLQTQRRHKGISLEAVSRLTRVSMTSLRQIESEDLNNLPAAVFVKGFLRAYAESVGLDPSEALERYENSLEDHAEKKQKQAEQLKPTASFFPRLFWAVFLMALIIAATLYFFKTMVSTEDMASDDRLKTMETLAVKEKSDQYEAGQPETYAPPAVTESPATQPPVTGNAITQTQDTPLFTGKSAAPFVDEPVRVTGQVVPEPLQSETVRPPGLLKLRLKADELTWLQVTTDGRSVKEYIIKVDEEITLQAESRFTVKIGNAGGVHLWLNDNPVEIKGRSGQVVTLQLP